MNKILFSYIAIIIIGYLTSTGVTLVCERKFSTKSEKWCVPVVPLYASSETYLDRVAFGLTNGIPQVISLAKAAPLLTFNQKDAHTAAITQIRYVDSTEYIITISKVDSNLKIWNVVTGNFERSFSIDIGAVNFV